MGNKSSRKKHEEFAPFQKQILDVDASCFDIVKSLDDVHLFAEKFVCQLEDREKRSIDAGFSNAELFCQRLMNLYEPAIRLLMAIEACNEKKKNMLKQVKINLHSINTELERHCKPKPRDFPVLLLDSYVRESEETRQIHELHQSNSERVRIVLNDSVKSVTVQVQLDMKVNELERKVLKMEDWITNSSLDKTSKELRLKRVEDTQEHLSVHIEEERKAKEKSPVLVDTLVQTEHIPNEELEESRLAVIRLTQEKEELSKKIVDLEEEVKTVRNQLELGEKHIKEKDRLSRDMQSCMASLEKEKQTAQEKAKEVEEDAEEKLKSLKNINQLLQEESDAMKLELEQLKTKKFLQVQLYSQQRSDLMSEIENDLMTLLKSKMNNRSTEVDFIKCSNISHTQTDKPLLTLCINASRLGTDAANTLHGIKVTANMAILVFHHKDVHALPNQASDRVLSGPQFKDLGGIFDMAFLSGKGIYSCEMNDNNIANVMDFIRKDIGGNGGSNSK